MAMNNRQLYEYAVHMLNGEWRQGKAEAQEKKALYSDAKDSYFKAMKEYERAESIALEGVDSRRREALSAVEHTNLKYVEMKLIISALEPVEQNEKEQSD